MKRFLVFSTVLAIAAIMLMPVALAQVSDAEIRAAVDAACANKGAVATVLAWIFGGSVAASLLANWSKLPAPVRTVVHAAALNFFVLAKKSAPAAAIVLFVALTGCTQFQSAASGLGTIVSDVFSGAPASQLSADQAAFATEVGAYQAAFQADLANANSNALTVGKDGCALASELNGLFTSPLGQVAVAAGTAAAGTPTAASAVDAEEANIFSGQVTPACAAVTTATATGDVAAAAAETATIAEAVPALQALLEQKSPAVAQAVQTAAAAAPAPATATPAPAATSAPAAAQ